MQINILSVKRLKSLAIIIISLCCVAFMVNKMMQIDVKGQLQLLHNVNWLLLIFAQLLLLCLNFSIEAFRWQVLMRGFGRLKFVDSLKAAFAASALGAFSPGRIGEHWARTFWGEAANISKVSVSVLASILQTTVIVLAFVFVLLFGSVKMPNLSVHAMYYVVAVAIFIALALLLCYVRKIKKEIWQRVLWHLKSDYRCYAYGFVLTLLRYFVFSFQLFIILNAFCPTANAIEIFLRLPIYYFLITVIPSMFVADIGIKGGAAVFVFSSIMPVPTVVAAILTMWLINTAIPALVGSFIMFQHSICSNNRR